MAPAVMPAGANTEFNKVELFGHQENMIQFDLDKIARDYQASRLFFCNSPCCFIDRKLFFVFLFNCFTHTFVCSDN